MTVVIRDRFRDIPIEGELIAEESSRADGQLRWVEMKLYRLAAGGWMVHRAGRSVIYHTAGTPCRNADGQPSGDEAGIDDLPDDAEPCSKCAPPWPEDLSDDDIVRFEFTRHTLNECESGPKVVECLSTARPRGRGVATVRLSRTANTLLAKAARNDREFAASLR